MNIDWDEKGLPPVGLKAEAYYRNDTNPDWKPFTLLYFSESTVIYEGCGETVKSRSDFDRYGPVEYRSLKTAKQSAVEQMQLDMGRWVNTEEIALHLYNAGYRKFEIVEEDV